MLKHMMTFLVILLVIPYVTYSEQPKFGIVPNSISEVTTSEISRIFCMYNLENYDVIFSFKSGDVIVEDKKILVEKNTQFNTCKSEMIKYKATKSGKFYVNVIDASNPNRVLDVLNVNVVLASGVEEQPKINYTTPTQPFFNFTQQCENKEYDDITKYLIGFVLGLIVGIISFVIYSVFL